MTEWDDLTEKLFQHRLRLMVGQVLKCSCGARMTRQEEHAQHIAQQLRRANLAATTDEEIRR